MKRCLIAILLVGVVGLAHDEARAQPVSPEHEGDIRRLLEATRARDMTRQIGTLMSREMAQAFQFARLKQPERAVEIAQDVAVSDLAAGFDVEGGLASVLVPIYAKYFTHEEVRALLEFYESPLGRKSVKMMPALLQEAAGAGQMWATGRSDTIAAKVVERLAAEGIK